MYQTRNNDDSGSKTDIITFSLGKSGKMAESVHPIHLSAHLYF